MAHPLFVQSPHLVGIEVLGRRLMVPAGDSLLRQLQYVFPSVGEGRFCWNGECRECEITMRLQRGGTAVGLACQLRGSDGLDVVGVSPELRYRLGTPHPHDGPSHKS
jgi:hypothetical protein